MYKFFLYKNVFLARIEAIETQNRKQNNINSKRHRKVANLKSNFRLLNFEQPHSGPSPLDLAKSIYYPVTIYCGSFDNVRLLIRKNKIRLTLTRT